MNKLLSCSMLQFTCLSVNQRLICLLPTYTYTTIPSCCKYFTSFSVTWWLSPWPDELPLTECFSKLLSPEIPSLYYRLTNQNQLVFILFLVKPWANNNDAKHKKKEWFSAALFLQLKDSAYYCYCTYVLRISRYSDFLSPLLTNTGIFLRGLKLSTESRS